MLQPRNTKAFILDHSKQKEHNLKVLFYLMIIIIIITRK